MIWSFQELVQAAIQMMKMSALQCSRVDQVAIFTVFHMIFGNLTAEAFNPSRTKSLYTHGNVEYFIKLSLAKLRVYSVEWKDDR
jgi:hypothetical protein